MALGVWMVLVALLGSAAAAEAAAAARDEESCTCVPYYLCDNKDVVFEGSAGLLDVAYNEKTCESYLDVCCKKPMDTPPPPAGTREQGECGRRNPQGAALMPITGDVNEAQFGEFPWMAAVLREEPSTDTEAVNTNYVCGGSLISPSVVLTAAHCVARKMLTDPLWVRLGEWDTQTTKEPLPQQDLRVVKVTVHPDFHNKTLYNDVALLTLEKPADLADHVDVVCLPPQDAVFDGSRCFASGWGKDKFGKEGIYQVILKKVERPVVPRKDCIDKLRETRLGKSFVLHESFMCAGREDDTCQGDGGGPLVCPVAGDPTRYQQVGIVAWGICNEGVPAVYANVAKFRDWIDQEFLSANLNTTYVP